MGLSHITLRGNSWTTFLASLLIALKDIYLVVSYIILLHGTSYIDLHFVIVCTGYAKVVFVIRISENVKHHRNLEQ